MGVSEGMFAYLIEIIEKETKCRKIFVEKYVIGIKVVFQVLLHFISVPNFTYGNLRFKFVFKSKESYYLY